MSVYAVNLFNVANHGEYRAYSRRSANSLRAQPSSAKDDVDLCACEPRRLMTPDLVVDYGLPPSPPSNSTVSPSWIASVKFSEEPS
jgi:hypothetical protein